MYLRNSYYQYCFYIVCNGGCPYYSQVFNSLQEALNWLNEIEKKAKHYNRIIYVDNKFYNNHYNECCKFMGTYYKLLVRPTNEWEEY